MKPIALTLSALLLASFHPFGVLAVEPYADMNTDQNVIDDYTYQLTTNIEDPTSAFLSLDEPSREALSSYNNVAGVNSLAYQIIDYAKNYLGRPYRSGAKGPRAFDCSGFTSFVFRNFDISLSPSSRTQYTQGEQINISDVRPGDLLFFGGRRGGSTVGHVAMAVEVKDNGTIKFIHAAQRGICYDTYPDGGYYSKRFIGARRVIQ